MSHINDFLVAHYSLEEAQGAGRIDVVSGYTLTDFGGNVEQNANRKFGDFAAGYNNLSNQVLNRDNSEFSWHVGSAAGRSFCIALWAYFDSGVTVGQVLFSKYQNTGNQRAYFCQLQGTTSNVIFRLYYGGDSETKAIDVLATGVTLATGQWYHVCAYYDLARGRQGLAVNGSIYEVTNFTGHGHQGEDTFCLGRHVFNTTGLRGQIDNLSVFNHAPTPEEVAYLASGADYPFAFPGHDNGLANGLRDGGTSKVFCPPFLILP